MNIKLITTAAIAAGTVLSSGISLADEAAPKDVSGSTESYPRKLAPVNHALELGIATGYAQGIGNVGAGLPSLTDVGSAGGAVQLDVGYRIIPRLTLGVYGTGAMFSRGNSVDNTTNLYSATAGIEAAYHFLPNRELDPWLSLGSGWRGYWANSSIGTTSQHGLELARLQAGVDFRLAREIAISPVIGADLSTFLTQQTANGDGSWHNVPTPNVNTFVFAGVMGRFDIPTDSASSNDVASR